MAKKTIGAVKKIIAAAKKKTSATKKKVASITKKKVSAVKKKAAPAAKRKTSTTKKKAAPVAKKKTSATKKKTTAIAQKKPSTAKKKVASKTKNKPTTTKMKKPSTTATTDAIGVEVKPYTIKKNEEYMNSKQLAHFEQILLNWKIQLQGERQRTVHHMQEDAANYPDPIDRASQEEEFGIELRTRDREHKLTKKIDDAIDRIKGQEYGYCADCGAEIGIRRLEARPTATQCIECKTVAEIREKQTGI